jgi:nucleotide-binding universal stress UspA family protein
MGTGRIAVLFETGRRGARALDQAAELAARSGSELTVVVLAPQAPALRGCVPSAAAYNSAVIDAAEAELRDAAHLLEEIDTAKSYKVLVEGFDPPLKTWLAEGGFDAVVMPARRRILSGGEPSVMFATDAAHSEPTRGLSWFDRGHSGRF